MHPDPFCWFLLMGLHRIKYNLNWENVTKKNFFAKYVHLNDKSEQSTLFKLQLLWNRLFSAHMSPAWESHWIHCTQIFVTEDRGIGYSSKWMNWWEIRKLKMWWNLLQRTTRLTPLPRRPKSPVMRVATPESQNFHSCAYQTLQRVQHYPDFFGDFCFLCRILWGQNVSWAWLLTMPMTNDMTTNPSLTIGYGRICGHALDSGSF